MLKPALRAVALTTLILSTAATGHWCLKQLRAAGNPIDLRELGIARNTGLRMRNGNPFTGEAIAQHPNGQRSKSEQFQAGRRHGHVQHWFEDGSLAFTATFEHGKRHGESSSWWRNGNQRSLTRYVQGYKDGEALQWYRGGELFKRMQYEAGQPKGLQQGWRKNGKLFSNFEYRNGRAYGLRNANLCVELEDEALVVSR